MGAGEGKKNLNATSGSQLGWKNWEADGQCWGKSTSCMD